VLRRTATASQQKVFSRNLRLGDYVLRTRPQQKVGCDAIKTMVQQKSKNTLAIMEMPAKQTPATSSEIVKLIRKLRWAGLEDKAQQLEKELERHVVSDPVISIQARRTNTNEGPGRPSSNLHGNVAPTREINEGGEERQFIQWRKPTISR
jgi:hypothetical protein